MTTKATITAALAALLLTASCSGKPEVLEPDTGATTPSAARPTPTEGSGPPLPVKAKEMTPSGAATFALHWAKTSDYAAHSGDTEPLKVLSDSACKPCQRFIELYESTYSEGGWIKGGDQSFKDVELRGDPQDKVFVYAAVSRKVGKFKPSRADSARVEPKGSDDLVYTVAWKDGRWKMMHQALESTR